MTLYIKKIIYFILIQMLFFSCSSLPLLTIVDIKDTLTAEEHNDLGVLYEKQNKHDLAEKEYLKAIKKKNNWAMPYFNLGNLYFKKSLYKKSESNYKTALKFNKNYSDCMNNLAYLLYEIKRYKEAKIYIEKALQIKKTKQYYNTYKKIQDKLN